MPAKTPGAPRTPGGEEAKRSLCLFGVLGALGVLALGISSSAALPQGNAPPAVSFTHFPDRQHAFVWRNWNLVEPARLAKVLGTDQSNVAALAASMGLPPAQPVSPHWRTRGYITLIRRNWHVLPYEQLLELLDMPAERLEEVLREDDFLFVKLGNHKPKCNGWPTPRRTTGPRRGRRRSGGWSGNSSEASGASPRRRRSAFSKISRSQSRNPGRS